MSEEKDIKDFSERVDLFSSLQDIEVFEPIYKMETELLERSNLYLEFLAAAFLKETGLKASEVELVISYELDKVKFHYQKRNNAGS